MKMGWYNAGETAGTMLVRNDRRVADGLVVAMNRGNARGAKEPYC